MKIKELFESNLHQSEFYIDAEKYKLLLHQVLIGNSSISMRQREQLDAAVYDESTKTFTFKGVFHPKLQASLLYDGELPFQFGDFDGDTFEYSEPNYWKNGLASLKHFPKSIQYNFIISASGFNDYSNGPEYVGKQYTIKSDIKEIKNLKVKAKILRLECYHLEKLSGFSKSEIDEIVILGGDKLKGNFLSLLRIKGLKKVHALSGIKKFSECDQALGIIRKYLAQETPNIVACQEELFKNGLDEYAKL